MMDYNYNIYWAAPILEIQGSNTQCAQYSQQSLSLPRFITCMSSQPTNPIVSIIDCYMEQSPFSESKGHFWLLNGSEPFIQCYRSHVQNHKHSKTFVWATTQSSCLPPYRSDTQFKMQITTSELLKSGHN